MKNVALHTLGCKLNYAETSTITDQFVERGFRVVEDDEPADVFVLNTCSVTERADRECRQLIRRALRRRQDTFIVVLGCYAQLQPGEIAEIEGVDLIVGVKDKFRIFEHAGNFQKKDIPQIFVSCIDEATEFDPASSATVGEKRTRAFLKIQDGCDYPCTYCTIPQARGASRSRSVGEILSEVSRIGREGYREIVLTGVNVGDYGRKDGSSLLELMRQLDRSGAGIDRIRISSIEPNLLTSQTVDFMLSSEKFCKHFHVPLQSGSDAILRLMRRRYDTGAYSRLIREIRRKGPDAGIGVDVIVGFPGETDALFRETMDFLSGLECSYLHVFTYSERPGTPGARMGGSVPKGVRSERSALLRELGQRKRSEFHSRFLGRRVPVLFEEEDAGAGPVGLTSEYVRVGVESDAGAALTNQIRDVLITGASPGSCSGTLLREEFTHNHS